MIFINSNVVDISEDEADTDDDTNSIISRFSHLSRSEVSELPDSSSAVIVHPGGCSRPQIVPQLLKRDEKAWHAVNELVESEHRYVQKLGLLEKVSLNWNKQSLKHQRNVVFIPYFSFKMFTIIKICSSDSNWNKTNHWTNGK